MRKIIWLILLISTLAFRGEPGWTIIYNVRVTYYAPSYDEACRLGHTASGMRCVYDADVVALGPELLRLVRSYYTNPAKYGAYPLKACWDCEPQWWAMPVRLCANGVCKIFRVADTGSDKLEVDLPRGTWQEFGYPLSQGVFYAELQIPEEE